MKLTLYPNSFPGNGAGHVKRAEQIKDDLSQSHRVTIMDHKNFHSHRCAPGELIVYDQRSTLEQDFQASRGVSAVGLDEGGPCRMTMDYLVDTLPNLETHKANALAFHREFSHRKTDLIFPPQKILISFGGVDEKGLSSLLVNFLLNQGFNQPEDITLVQGPGFTQNNWPNTVRVVKNLLTLDKEIVAADLVFTHFGLTCFEALYQGVPVVLLNPSDYHEKLSQKAGLYSLGVNVIQKNRFFHLFRNPERACEIFKKQLSHYQQAPALLSRILSELKPEAINRCPLCGEDKNPAIDRFPGKSYFQCRKCALIYAIPFARRDNPYKDSYFFEEYHKQYGKSYLDDFEHIKQLSRTRLRIIAGLLGNEKALRILDIGCAYGPFLGAAKEAGHEAQGIEISPSAAEYVTTTLGLPCICCDVSRDFPVFTQAFDAVSFWYVLEHFAQLNVLLTKVNRALKLGGILALGLPNSQGISMKKNRTAYLKAHPDDHFTLWGPGTIKKQLRLMGFCPRRIKITGHHGERFPVLGRFRIFRGFLNTLSRLFGLGDTFEVYAVKERDM